MTMNKMFAGLIAFVAGVALSAGSAFATAGYMVGDPAMSKLVPYYETGDTRATIIAIQNLSPQEAKTMELDEDAKNIQAYLDGAILTDDGTATGTASAAQTRAIGLINAEDTDASVPDASATAKLGDTQRNLRAIAEAALAKANGKTYTEHIFVTVNVYDAMGMMMEDATAELCLSENQFGYVILQGPTMQDSQEMDSNQNALRSAMDGEIPEYGYVKVMASTMKYHGCEFVRGGIATVETPLTDPNSAFDATTNPRVAAMSRVATWAIIQDTGTDGFFGTEVSSSTITMMMDNEATAADESKMTNCYGAIADAAGSGDFMPSNCGLIPEVHDMDTDDDTGGTTSSGRTAAASAYARYDTDSDSMIYVWLAEGEDTFDEDGMNMKKPTERRALNTTVMCMNGNSVMAMDDDGVANKPIRIHAPHKLTKINPADMDGLGMYTDMCTDDTRGVLKITMPMGSKAGMVFTHIQQMGKHYRMNFPGYGMAPTE